MKASSPAPCPVRSVPVHDGALPLPPSLHDKEGDKHAASSIPEIETSRVPVRRPGDCTKALRSYGAFPVTGAGLQAPQPHKTLVVSEPKASGGFGRGRLGVLKDGGIQQVVWVKELVVSSAKASQQRGNLKHAGRYGETPYLSKPTAAGHEAAMAYQAEAAFQPLMILHTRKPGSSSKDYLVLEAADCDLLQLMSQLSLTEKRAIAVRMIHEAQTYHRHGVAHRDLKADNILIRHEANERGFTLGAGDFANAAPIEPKQEAPPPRLKHGHSLPSIPATRQPPKRELSRSDSAIDAPTMMDNMLAIKHELQPPERKPTGQALDAWCLGNLLLDLALADDTRSGDAGQFQLFRAQADYFRRTAAFYRLDNAKLRALFRMYPELLAKAREDFVVWRQDPHQDLSSCVDGGERAENFAYFDNLFQRLEATCPYLHNAVLKLLDPDPEARVRALADLQLDLPKAELDRGAQALRERLARRHDGKASDQLHQVADDETLHTLTAQAGDEGTALSLEASGHLKMLQKITPVTTQSHDGTQTITSGYI